MNKADLSQAVAGELSWSKADAARAVDAVFEQIGIAMRDGKSVILIGFGTFSVRKRPARTGRNPRTGAALEIPNLNVPIFKPGKALKDSIN
jgi:DNA-binding protein HU-beta